MRSATSLLAAVLAIGILCGQEPEQIQPDAKSRLARLNALHSERIKGLDRDDETARARVNDLHVAELSEFLRIHGDTTTSNQTRLRLGMMATRNSAYTEAARVALEGFVPGADQIGIGLMAARTSDRLKLTATKAKIVQAVSASAKTITAKMDLVMQLKLGMKDPKWADRLMREVEAMTKTDAQKAELLMGKANLMRATPPKDKARYQGALKDLAATYPTTPHGMLARDKLAAAELKVGDTPIPFAVQDTDGQTVTLKDFEGKVLLIDFWATWCRPCMQEMPQMVAAYDNYASRGLEILGISLDRDSQRDRFDQAIVKHGMRWRHVCDGMHWQTTVAQRYDVTSIPFTILIGRDGKIAGLNLHGNELEQALIVALNPK
jgi:peroxiredoxin